MPVPSAATANADDDDDEATSHHPHHHHHSSAPPPPRPPPPSPGTRNSTTAPPPPPPLPPHPSSTTSSSTSIRPLPPQTARALRSSLTIVDPASAVKELVDNALDAGATSVGVEVSGGGTGAAGLDLVVVRDNGRSVPPVGEDRVLLGRRHCTSKVRWGAGCAGEMQMVGGLGEGGGGTSGGAGGGGSGGNPAVLGFRGEALASLVEVCEKVEVTVRCEGERVGEVLRLGREGEDLQGVAPRKVGAPVGTTVRAEGFFERWPVRRQAALKEAEKGGGGGGVMRRIKGLLQGYALARPAVRLSLKVVKGRGIKNGKEGGWTYAPKPGLGLGGGRERVADAVLKVVGKGAAAQCIYAAQELNGYRFEAFLPRADAEGKEISGLGQFLSVDARPVSTARGTLSLIAKAFRDRLKKANPALENVKEPFLRLDIGCPPGSYDPNVEPSKSDLLFDEPKAVLSALEDFLDIFYSSAGPQMETAKIHESKVPTQREISLVEDTVTAPDSEAQKSDDDVTTYSDIFDEFVMIPATDVAHPPASSDSIAATLRSNTEMEDVEDPRPKRRRTWKSNMYDFDEDDVLVDDGNGDAQGNPDVDLADEDTEEAMGHVTVSNPWTMAKMNAKIPKPSVASSPEVAHMRKQNTEPQLELPTSTPPESRISLGGAYLPTPQASSPNYGQSASVARCGGFGGTNLTQSPATPSATFAKSPNSHLPFPQNSSRQVDDDGFVPVPPQPVGGGTVNSAKTATPKRSRLGGPGNARSGRRGINKPFKPPINPERDSWFSYTPSQRPKRSTVFLRKNKIPAAGGDDARNEYVMSGGADGGGLSDGHDRDIRHWMASNTTRVGRTQSDNGPGIHEDAASIQDSSVASEETRPALQQRLPATPEELRIRNFDFNMKAPAPFPRITQSRLTVQNRPSATSQRDETEEHTRQETADTAATAQPLRRSFRRHAAARPPPIVEKALYANEEIAKQPLQSHPQLGQSERQQQQHSGTGTGLVPLRRLSTRQQSRRRTTSSLPLERVPDGAQMQNVALIILSSAAAALSTKRTTYSALQEDDVALSWGASGDLKSPFAKAGDDDVTAYTAVVQSWADRLGNLLMRFRLDGVEGHGVELRQDLSFVLMDAVERYRRGQVMMEAS
ncbi:dna mismatch repair protein [Diplodia corticola]|uniref:Dna mismatch repair protein n=1 Tax=Diplodia corticola TaxID=236234 RepID=A0A1J9QY22_9PEZI|nr:dna mismatch repair protein [Diplodia corticola]OJD32898.1 dna mismatch repair protein [Diplodia corticola]